jgi:16S rRNA C967 or C1407 C5-methylase (RsmB/RsmF family)/NOL1/NOP2/fmu family ribosome biogenesis protein
LGSFLPLELLSSLKKMDHFDPEAFQRVHESGKQLVSVHLNSEKPILYNGKWNDETFDPPFELAGKVPWTSDAYYLSSRPFFTMDPLFHAGTYYVQEASGMFVSFALKQIADLSQKLKVLDLCAAPGGKSTLIQSLISPESLLLSNEVIKTRVPVLTQNMTKWGRGNSIVSNNDPSHFKRIPGFFDIILIDAPCSGSGLYRKDPEAASSWSTELVKLCSQRQQRILSDAWDCLKEDGFLIYSTCSYSKEENEDILDFLFSQYSCNSITLNPDPLWNIVETKSDLAAAFGYRFYPDKLPGEGFFLAVIQKKQTANFQKSNHHVAGKSPRAEQTYKSNKRPGAISKSTEMQIQEWVQPDIMKYVSIEDSIHALMPDLVSDFELLKNNLYLKKAGIRIGKAGEREWIPDHELALADLLRHDSPSLHVSKSDALDFLRGNPFDTQLMAKGWHTVCFQGQRLGWVKLLDKRMNNYYPKAWRIRQ